MPARRLITLTGSSLTALTLLAITVTIATGTAGRAGGARPASVLAGATDGVTAGDACAIRSRVPAGRKPYGTGRGPASHLCPVAGCQRPVSPDRFMCRPHWYRVAKPLRDMVWATWRSGAGTGTREHTTALLAAIGAASLPRPAAGTG